MNDNEAGPVTVVIIIIVCFIIGFGIGAAVVSAQWCHALEYDVGGWDLFKGSYCHNEIEVETIYPNER